ncbi:MAG: hypothetical protein H6549_09790 [Chitinophagales bacterium]|nr:hypothetical protein [Chitinophagales bacterium]
MRDRLWNELTQSKHHHIYCVLLIAYQRRLVNIFNIVILSFSSAGVMGWAFWKELPLVSCIIVAGISLLKLLSPHLVPSEKQLDKLDNVIDFYCDYYNKVEQLWMNHYNGHLDDKQMQDAFYKLKATEGRINKIVNEIVKRTNKSILSKTEKETLNYLKRTFNTK